MVRRSPEVRNPPSRRCVVFNLEGKIALVTGASRGVGKGVALGLAEAQATLFVTARTASAGKGTESLPGSLSGTVQEADMLGGRATALQCDHTDDEQVRRVFERIDSQHGQLDILVNCVWGGYERMSGTARSRGPGRSRNSRSGNGMRCSDQVSGRTTWQVSLPQRGWSRQEGG